MTVVVHISATTKADYNGFEDLSAERGRQHMSVEFTCLGHQWQVMIDPGGFITARDGMALAFLLNLSDEGINIKYKFNITN